MSEELKPCPFCPSPTDVRLTADDAFWAVVFCSCGAHGAPSPDEDKAVEYWNTRPIEDALRAALEMVEWTWKEFYPEGGWYCPWCDGESPIHAPDCPRQVALGLEPK